MRLDVISDYTLGHLPYRADKVAIGPEAIASVDPFQFEAFLADLARALFVQVDDLSRGIAWFGGEQQMDMVGLDVQFQDLELIDLSAETDYYFQTPPELTLEDPFAVFRDPDKVIPDAVNDTSGLVAFLFGLKRPEFLSAKGECLLDLYILYILLINYNEMYLTRKLFSGAIIVLAVVLYLYLSTLMANQDYHYIDFKHIKTPIFLIDFNLSIDSPSKAVNLFKNNWRNISAHIEKKGYNPTYVIFFPNYTNVSTYGLAWGESWKKTVWNDESVLWREVFDNNTRIFIIKVAYTLYDTYMNEPIMNEPIWTIVNGTVWLNSSSCINFTRSEVWLDNNTIESKWQCLAWENKLVQPSVMPFIVSDDSKVFWLD